jgi:gluconolactonase
VAGLSIRPPPPTPMSPHDATHAEPAFTAYDERFAEVVGDAPRLARVADADAHEGPVYAADEDALYFTTLPRAVDVPAPGWRRVSIARLALDGERFPVGPGRVTLVREDAGMANGMAMGHDGRLVVCEQGTRSDHARIARVDRRTGEAETVVDSWGGLRFNSPNDVVVAPDGAVWFTDPSYGHLQGFRPEPVVADFVYRHDPATGRTAVVADGFDKPNGIALSPAGGVLYVTDSGANQEPGSYHAGRPHHITAFDVVDGRRLGPGRLFAVTTPGVPDGIKVDRDGRVYASCSAGVQVFAPDGDLIGLIALPGAVNFTFGGPGRNVLYVTSDSAVWAAVLAARGPEPPAPAHADEPTPKGA